MLLKRGVSMQEVFNRVASMMCEENPYMMKIIDDIQIEKKEKHIKQVTKSDSDTLFELIENTNPFSNIESFSKNESK